MEKLTLENLPQAVTNLSDQVNQLTQIILDKNTQEYKPTSDKLLTIKEAADYLNLSVPTIYGLVSKRKIPFMKRSKRLYFSNEELMDYIKEGRIKTNSEIEAEADAYLANKKGGNHV